MRVRIGFWLLALSLLGMPAESFAQTITLVDTGPGRSAAAPGDITLTSTQFLAGQFTLVAPHEIVAIEGWLAYLSIAGSLPVDVVVYGDDEGLPDTNDEYYRQLFSVPSAGVVIPYPGGWHGISGVSFVLRTGTYWVAFEPPTSDFGTGVMPPTDLLELDAYAIGAGVPPVWSDDDSNPIGLRIESPEPGFTASIAFGVLGMLAGRRRKRARPEPGGGDRGALFREARRARRRPMIRVQRAEPRPSRVLG